MMTTCVLGIFCKRMDGKSEVESFIHQTFYTDMDPGEQFVENGVSLVTQGKVILLFLCSICFSSDFF